jgi:hypothetical protein
MIKEGFMYRCPVLYGGSAPNSISDPSYIPRTFTKLSDYANEVGFHASMAAYMYSSDFVGLKWGHKLGAHVSALKIKRNSQTKLYRLATYSTKLK